MATRESALLQALDQAKHSHGSDCAAECERVLKSANVRFTSAQGLIRAHDDLLFLRAFPPSAKVAKLADSLLASLIPQIEQFAAADPTPFDNESVSGIAGTTITNAWTFELAKFLVRHHTAKITADCSFDDAYRQMATVLPQVLPLLDDDSYVEADTPFVKWLEAAAGGVPRVAQFLINSFQRLPVTPLLRTNLYDSLGISLRWQLGNSLASRTLARRPVARLFVHNEPRLQRKQVSLHDELNSAPLPLKKLSREEAQSIIDMARDALAVRYRELQGSTNADPNHAFQADVGRGVQLFIWGLAAEWRLPLRAYYAGFTLKNGVPINYFESIGLFEWMEIGFNTFYAFREGETAWIYSKVLHLLNQLAGITCFSVYPYQIGQDNEEAIQSGAFWFYRKLGFRPGRSDLLSLAWDEERKMQRNPKHRTSASILRKLAEGHIFFEVGGRPLGAWDTFSTRKIGLAVQRKMATEFGSDAIKMCRRTSAKLARMLGVELSHWQPGEQQAFSNFALALSLGHDFKSWSTADKKALVAIIRTKAGPYETRYLRLLQKHEKLRATFLLVGST